MKGKLSVILAILLTLALALPMVAAAGEQVAEREVDQARRRGQAWVEEIAVIDPEMAEWQGAYLTRALPFHNTKGEVIAYMFAVERDGKTLGRVLVGSSAYGHSILEASQGPPLSIPARGEVSSILRKEHGLQIADARIGEPMLLLLNILRGFYAVWEIEGQVVGINLVSHDSFTVSRLEEIRSSMPSPWEYKAAKRATSQSFRLSEAKLQAYWGAGWIPFRGEMCARWTRDYGGAEKLWCGPASATTIALWKRDADNDGGFPDNVTKIFDGFRADIGGGPTFYCEWRDGFKSYAQSRGEQFTLEVRKPGSYWQIVGDINAGWPLGLMGTMDIDGEMKPHWVAVEGYSWIGSSEYMLNVEDTFYSGPHEEPNRWLCWHMLNNPVWWFPHLWVIAVRDTD